MTCPPQALEVDFEDSKNNSGQLLNLLPPFHVLQATMQEWHDRCLTGQVLHLSLIPATIFHSNRQSDVSCAPIQNLSGKSKG